MENSKAWLKKYYPVKAKTLADASDIECTKHSLNKWRGLTEEVLKQYGFVTNGYAIQDDSFVFYVDSNSCALCKKYLLQKVRCEGCPVFKQLGKSCDEGRHSPYQIFRTDGNPLPMIETLEKTLLSLQHRKEDGKQ